MERNIGKMRLILSQWKKILKKNENKRDTRPDGINT
jgi:hypothetical protein